MKLTDAKCPSCGASIEVDKNSDTTICDYCNSKIIVEDAIAKYKVELTGEVRLSNASQIEQITKVADRAYKYKDYAEAKEKYDKIIDMDADNINAILKKAYCSLYLNSLLNSNLIEIEKANKIVYDIVNGDSAKVYEFIKQTDEVLQNYEEYISDLYENNVAPDIKTVTHQTWLLFEIAKYKALLCNLTTDPKQKKEISKSIMHSCYYQMLARDYMMPDGRKGFYRNPYEKETMKIKQKYQALIDPNLKVPTANSNNKMTNGKTILEKLHMKKKDAILLICLLPILLIEIIFFAYATFFYKNGYENNTYENEGISIKFVSNDKLVYSANGEEKEYYFTHSYERTNVYRIKFDNYVYEYDTEKDQLCLIVEESCSIYLNNVSSDTSKP